MGANPTRPVSVVFFRSAQFGRILIRLRQLYTTTGQPEYLVVPYIVTCAAALQAKLNDAYVQHAEAAWPGNDNVIAKAYLSMSFRRKLDLVAPVMTTNRYQFDHSHVMYKRLVCLITVRNELVHAKPLERSMHIGTDFSLMTPKLPQEYFTIVDDLTLGASKPYTPLEYHEAIEALQSDFFLRLPDQLDGSPLLHKNRDA